MFVKSSFNLPDYCLKIVKCRTPDYLNILEGSVSNKIISHINGGDIKGAIDILNCKKTNETNLVQLVTQELEMELKNLGIEMEMRAKMNYSSEKEKESVLGKIQNNIETNKIK